MNITILDQAEAAFLLFGFALIFFMIGVTL